MTEREIPPTADEIYDQACACIGGPKGDSTECRRCGGYTIRAMQEFMARRAEQAADNFDMMVSKWGEAMRELEHYRYALEKITGQHQYDYHVYAYGTDPQAIARQCLRTAPTGPPKQ